MSKYEESHRRGEGVLHGGRGDRTHGHPVMHAAGSGGNGGTAAPPSSGQSPLRVAVVASEVADLGSPGSPPSSPVASMPKKNFIQKNSLAYIVPVLWIAIPAVWVLGAQVTFIGYEHVAELQPNLRKPWFPFCYMKSKGVDVADLQWYYFVLALPPMTPILALFLFLSRKLKAHSAPVVMPYSPASAAAAAAERASSRNVSGNEGEAYERAVEVITRTQSPLSLTESSPASPDEHGDQSSASGDDPNSSYHGAAVGVPVLRVAESGEVGGGGGGLTHKHLYFGRNLTSVYIVHVAFGAVIAALITGPGFLFGIALMLFNYYGIAQLQKHFSYRFCMVVMWTVHIAILFLNFHMDGYRFAWFGLSFLDHLYSPLMRWNVHYNMSVLRMIAFNSDYWEARMHGEERREKALSKHFRCCVQCAVIRDNNRHISPTGGQAESLRCYKCRTECPRPLEEYNLLAYMAFLFYPPLFIAGPMASFNGYVSHLHYPTRAMVGKAVVRYGLRFLMNAVTLASMMHYIWVTAILYTQPSDVGKNAAHAEKTWGAVTDKTSLTDTTITTTTAAASVSGQKQLSVFQQIDYVSKAKLLFLFLSFMWLKFNVFWKFFRFFALLDGVDPPEDMRRCFSNTTTIQGFWRDWHASFNLWIVRYMYIPMGGRQRIKFTVFPIFFFIAIWHDIELRLLYWALFMCIFMAPEITVSTFFASKHPLALKVKRNVRLYGLLRLFATTFNMILLIVVNLIGFSIGMSGAESAIDNLLSNVTVRFTVSFVSFFLSGAVIALQSRDQEAYEDQVLKIKYGIQSR